MNQNKAEQLLADHLWNYDDSEAVDFISYQRLGEALRAFDPAVLAAALGGHAQEVDFIGNGGVRTVIVLPEQE